MTVDAEKQVKKSKEFSIKLDEYTELRKIMLSLIV